LQAGGLSGDRRADRRRGQRAARLLAAPAAALQWGASLALELAIVVALGLFCIVTFSQLMPAASFMLAFYLLARALTAIRLMSAHPLVDADSLSHSSSA